MGRFNRDELIALPTIEINLVYGDKKIDTNKERVYIDGNGIITVETWVDGFENGFWNISEQHFVGSNDIPTADLARHVTKNNQIINKSLFASIQKDEIKNAILDDINSPNPKYYLIIKPIIYQENIEWLNELGYRVRQYPDISLLPKGTNSFGFIIDWSSSSTSNNPL